MRRAVMLVAMGSWTPEPQQGRILVNYVGIQVSFFFMFARVRQSRDLVVAPRDLSQDAMFQL